MSACVVPGMRAGLFVLGRKMGENEAGRTALRQRGYPALDPPFRRNRKEGPCAP